MREIKIRAIKYKRNNKMKAIELLKQDRDYCLTINNDKSIIQKYDEAIKELDSYITNYQGTKRRLDNTVTALTVLEHQNKSLVKTLEKYNEEMIELRKENQDLKESNNELLEGLISTQKRLEEWLEKCN